MTLKGWSQWQWSRSAKLLIPVMINPISKSTVWMLPMYNSKTLPSLTLIPFVLVEKISPRKVFAIVYLWENIENSKIWFPFIYWEPKRNLKKSDVLFKNYADQDSLMGNTFSTKILYPDLFSVKTNWISILSFHFSNWGIPVSGLLRLHWLEWCSINLKGLLMFLSLSMMVQAE